MTGLRQLQMTTRWCIAAVAGAAVGMWMIAVVYRVQAASHKEDLFHLWVRKDLSRPEDRAGGLRGSLLGTSCCADFWPRYWRRLLGQPWPGTYRCRCVASEDAIDPAAPKGANNAAIAITQTYRLVGTRTGICYMDQCPQGRTYTWEEMEPWHLLIAEYQSYTKPGRTRKRSS
jgi:hypothetical protein